MFLCFLVRATRYKKQEVLPLRSVTEVRPDVFAFHKTGQVDLRQIRQTSPRDILILI